MEHVQCSVRDVATGGMVGLGGDLIAALTAALTGLTWRLRIDPQGLATVVATGQRRNDRHG